LILNLTPDQQAKLSRMAAAHGRAADKDEFVAHEDVRRMLEARYPA
jgi:hypothetical protein